MIVLKCLPPTLSLVDEGDPAHKRLARRQTLAIRTWSKGSSPYTQLSTEEGSGCSAWPAAVIRVWGRPVRGLCDGADCRLSHRVAETIGPAALMEAAGISQVIDKDRSAQGP